MGWGDSVDCHRFKKYSYIAAIIVMIFVTAFFSSSIFFYGRCTQYKPKDLDSFRCMDLPENIMKIFWNKNKEDKRQLIEKAIGKPWYEYYQAVLNDVEYFPIAKDIVGHETTAFDNSWLSERTYGGKRFHEGTDIMTSNNKRGYFKVISMTDGVIEKKGWLEKGGYRLGIRSKSGGYYYYAHLYEYARDLEEGSQVKAGQFLGTAGDSGYSKIEGTVGNFDVHLHIGIYLDIDGKETSINPYWILKYLKIL